MTEALVATVAPREDDGIAMAFSPAEAGRRLMELQAFVEEAMRPEIDYGKIPGTDKPTLFQPGAQKLIELYGLAFDFEDTEKVQDWDRGFFMYRKKCRLTLRRNGVFIGAGVGSCNSKEDRYAWRWVWQDKLPAGIDTRTLKQRTTGRGGVQYRLPNEDTFSLVNTIEKMACKRALVHAVLGVTRSSNLFGQDYEDLPEEVFGTVNAERDWDRGADAARTTAAGMSVQPAKPDTAPRPQPAPQAQPLQQVLAEALREIAALQTVEACAALGQKLAKVLPEGTAERKAANKAYAARRDELVAARKQQAQQRDDFAPGPAADGPCEACGLVKIHAQGCPNDYPLPERAPGEEG